ncbi:hydrolase [Lithospermum erythrorhizon]|uniref:Hydrolase n=1 Tax=Lithospermum erythrorhizon TaxID=34254 RepID=A0AAV3PZH7_LITER
MLELYVPYLKGRTLGKNVVFDMDMSAGDFVALFYLLNVPVEVINLKGILVSPTGWANAATIDIIYDLLHMMGRDDIPVGLGDFFGINRTDPIISSVGDCKYNKAIPHGSGGFLDSDTLYGLARDLPRSPQRYMAENSVEYGAPRDTDHPELRQPLAMETWREIVESLDPGKRISVLTNGPLTNLAKIILSETLLQFKLEIFIVGGHLSYDQSDKGNVINVPANKYAEMNMFLDPWAAKIVLESELNITLIPLGIQRKVSNFNRILEMLYKTNKTAEVLFTQHLLSRLHRLKQSHKRYQHMDIFLGEILGAITLANIDHPVLKPDFELKRVKVHADGDESQDGQVTRDEMQGRLIRVLEKLDIVSYYDIFAERLGDEKQSAVVGSFNAQKRMWSKAIESFLFLHQ